MSGYEKIIATADRLDYNLRLHSVMDFKRRSDKLRLLANDIAVLNRNWYCTTDLVNNNYSTYSTNLFMLDLCYNFLGDEGYV